MSNKKFNAVTLGFQKTFITCSPKTRRMANLRRKYKRRANRLARRHWFNGQPLATDWCW